MQGTIRIPDVRSTGNELSVLGISFRRDDLVDYRRDRWPHAQTFGNTCVEIRESLGLRVGEHGPGEAWESRVQFGLQAGVDTR